MAFSFRDDKPKETKHNNNKDKQKKSKKKKEASQPQKQKTAGKQEQQEEQQQQLMLIERYKSAMRRIGGLLWQGTYYEPMVLTAAKQFVLKLIPHLSPGAMHGNGYPKLSELTLTSGDPRINAHLTGRLRAAFEQQQNNNTTTTTHLALRYAIVQALALRCACVQRAYAQPARYAHSEYFVLKERKRFPALPAELAQILHSFHYGVAPIDAACRDALGIRCEPGLAGYRAEAPLHVVIQHTQPHRKLSGGARRRINLPAIATKARFVGLGESADPACLIARLRGLFDETMAPQARLEAYASDLEMEFACLQPMSTLVMPQASGVGAASAPYLESLTGASDDTRRVWITFTDLNRRQMAVAPLVRGRTSGEFGDPYVLSDHPDATCHIGLDPSPSPHLLLPRTTTMEDPRRTALHASLAGFMRAEEKAMHQALLGVMGYDRIVRGRNLRARTQGEPPLAGVDDFRGLHNLDPARPLAEWPGPWVFVQLPPPPPAAFAEVMLQELRSSCAAGAGAGATAAYGGGGGGGGAGAAGACGSSEEATAAVEWAKRSFARMSLLDGGCAAAVLLPTATTTTTTTTTTESPTKRNRAAAAATMMDMAAVARLVDSIVTEGIQTMSRIAPPPPAPLAPVPASAFFVAPPEAAEEPPQTPQTPDIDNEEQGLLQWPDSPAIDWGDEEAD